eukprot:SAG31_NODE_2607_length_5389_cov_1.257467_5_plen_364_part_00
MNRSALCSELCACKDAELMHLLLAKTNCLSLTELTAGGGCHQTGQQVGVSYKMKRLVQSLRRYAWDIRQMMLELDQNQQGIIPGRAYALLESVAGNADNMVEVAESLLEQCRGNEDFYESFQQKLVAGTLYVLTVCTVIIMPAQLLTGIFGMNFESGIDDEGAFTGPLGAGELQWKYGYPMFWTLVLSLTTAVFFFMYKRGMLRSRPKPTRMEQVANDEVLQKTEARREAMRERSRSKMISDSGSNRHLARMKSSPGTAWLPMTQEKVALLPNLPNAPNSSGSATIEASFSPTSASADLALESVNQDGHERSLPPHSKPPNRGAARANRLHANHQGRTAPTLGENSNSSDSLQNDEEIEEVSV